MKKVCVIGCPGSGKSTFSKKLSSRTSLPLYHLDMIWWNSDKTHVSREVFDGKLAEILPRDEWIIDGDYSRTYEVRLNACDSVFFFDLSEEECIKGITDRVGKCRTDSPFADSDIDPELLSEVSRYRSVKRPKVLALLDKCRAEGKNVTVFKSRSDADSLLKEEFPNAE